MQQCPLCRDTKHILSENVWIRCSCLNNHLANIAYSAAGVTLPLEELAYTPESLSKKWPGAELRAHTLEWTELLKKQILEKKTIPAKIYCYQGPPHSPRNILVQSVVKSVVDTGKTVKSASINDLIRDYFQDKTTFSLSESFLSHDLFVLSFGTEIQFQVAISFIFDLVNMHYSHIGKHALMLETTLPFDMLSKKYNDTFQSLFFRFNDINVANEEKRIHFMGVVA